MKTQKHWLIKEIENKEKSKEIVLLINGLNDILQYYSMNITNIAKYILEKLTNDQRIINYSNLSLEANNYSVVSDYDFFLKFGTLYN